MGPVWRGRSRAGRAALIAVLALSTACGEVPDRAANDQASTIADTRSTAVATSTSTTAPASTTRPTRHIRGFGRPIALKAADASGTEVDLADATAIATLDDLIAVATARGGLYVFDLAGRHRGVVNAAHHGRINALGVVGHVLVSGGEDGELHTWRIEDIEAGPVGSWTESDGSPVLQLAGERDGTTLLSAGADGLVRTWELTGGVAPGSPKEEVGPLDGSITALGSVVTEGGTMPVAATAGSIYLLHGATAESLASTSEVVTDLAATTHGQVLVAGPERPLTIGLDDRQAVPNSAVAASGTGTTAIDTWSDAAGGDDLVAVAGGPPPSEIAVTGTSGPDVVRRDAPGVVRLFVADHAGSTVEYPGLDGDVVALAFTANGAAVVTATADQVLLLPIATG